MDLPLDPGLDGWRDQFKPSDLYEEDRFAPDSLAEQSGFEPSVRRLEPGRIIFLVVLAGAEASTPETAESIGERIGPAALRFRRDGRPALRRVGARRPLLNRLL
jgi:hypothetical protein